MLRILRRTPSICGLEASGLVAILPSVNPIGLGAGQQFIGSTGFLACGSNAPSCRFYSTPVGRQTPSVWRSGVSGPCGIAGGLGVDKSLLSCRMTSVIFEQSRGYWGKEGRIGWLRRRRIEREQREQLLNPSSPVIDQRVPWPKDDFESLPPELFGEEIEELSPAELRVAQNAVLTSINNQVNSQTQGRLFAVVHVAGKQFKVTPEDIIIVQGLFHPTVGDQIRLHKVLLVGGKDFSLLGCPVIDSDLVRVEATVIEKSLSYTKMVFRMIKRSNYKRLKFMKSTYTMLRINLIELRQPLDMVKQSDAEAAANQQQSSSV